MPAVVDLAAMRDAMNRLGGDPAKINPLCPVDLVIDHSVQADVFGTADAAKQNEIIEAIFKKFDQDGSGSLDLGELVDLFKQNKVRLDKDTVKLMFQGNEFTLQKFKAIINSEDDLQRFKDVLGGQRKRILSEIQESLPSEATPSTGQLKKKGGLDLSRHKGSFSAAVSVRKPQQQKKDYLP